jgi:predicted DNA-binding transcriptional regulator AlpA
MRSFPHLKVISVPETADLIGVHITTVNRWYAAGTFVKKVRLGPNRVGFLAEDVHAWIEARLDHAA